MSEEIKVWKTSVDSSGNDWGYSGTVTIDLTYSTEKVVQVVSNEIRFYTPGRRPSQTNLKPEKRTYNSRKITDKIIVTGRITGPDAVTTKNKLIALMQAGGLVNFQWRNEIFDGSSNPKYAAYLIARFEDDYKRQIAISGTHTGGAASSDLIDSTKDFEVAPDFFRTSTTIKNITQSTEGTADSITNATTVACSSVTFNNGDSYQILTLKDNEVAYKFTLTFVKGVPRP